MTGCQWIWALSLVSALIVAAPGGKQTGKTSEIVFSEKDAGTIVIPPPKPQVWYFIPRAKLYHGQDEPTQKLVPKIYKATKKAPF